VSAVHTAFDIEHSGAREVPDADVRVLNTVGLFAGIGGIELGLEQAGHRTLELCEIDPAARAVLSVRFARVPLVEDVQRYEQLPVDAQLIAAGFPCQDLSQAGRTQGIEGSKSGLVSHVFRLLERNDVPWLLLENVSFMLRLSKGRAMEVIIDTLEKKGYRWAYRVVDSRALGVPQRRERVYLLASREEDPRDVLMVDDAGEPDPPESTERSAFGFYWTEGSGGLGWAVDAVPTLKGGSTIGIPSHPAIWLPTGEIVTPGIRDAERMQGFPADWTLPAEGVVRRGFRWKLVGNAVTVDVAHWIGERLKRPGEYSDEGDRRTNAGTIWPRAAYNVGHGRFASHVSSWPFHKPCEPLADFLNLDDAAPLSLRATSGFLSRFEKSTLRKPPGFLEALKAHKAKMERLAAAS
jgi:DNA (cytosine-5)-methyltransferase 1